MPRKEREREKGGMGAENILKGKIKKEKTVMQKGYECRDDVRKEGMRNERTRRGRYIRGF